MCDPAVSISISTKKNILDALQLNKMEMGQDVVKDLRSCN